MTRTLKQILSHARNSMSHALRSGSGVAFIVLTVLIGLALANFAFAPIELGFIELEAGRAGRVHRQCQPTQWPSRWPSGSRTSSDCGRTAGDGCQQARLRQRGPV